MGPYFIGFWLLLPVVCGLAFWRGGWPERWVAAMLLAAAVMTVLLLRTRAYHTVELGCLIVDVALTIGLAVIAIRADRWWPMLVTALQAVSVLAHIAKALDADLRTLGYQLFAEASSYPTLIVLMIGTIRHWRVASPRLRISQRS